MYHPFFAKKTCHVFSVNPPFQALAQQAHPDWSYEIWSDERVAKLPMFNEKFLGKTTT